MEEDCLFCDIARGEGDAEVMSETEDVVAFRDINPQAPTHILIIPRKHIPTVNDLRDEDADLIGKLYTEARDLADQEGIAEDGYRLVMNCNREAGQSVFHIHLHLLGGRSLSWPPG